MQAHDWHQLPNNFHEQSHHGTIVPILIATEAEDCNNQIKCADDHVTNVVLCNKANLCHHITTIANQLAQADIDAKDHQFDALWQSIYDVCKLIKFGIIEDITEEEFEEAYAWLKTTQSLTEDYQELELEF